MTKFHKEPPGTWGNEHLFVWFRITWPTWPSCPYMVKHSKLCFIENQMTNDSETLYEAWGTQVYTTKIVQIMTLGWPCPFFSARSNMGKCYKHKISWKFFEELRPKMVGMCSHLNEYMKICEYKRSRSFFDLWPRTLIFWQFQTVLLKNQKHWASCYQISY